MTRRYALLFGALGLALVLGTGSAWAEAKITVTREENKPQKVEVKVGEEVRWVNATGGIAHVSFAGQDGVQFYVGTAASRIKFAKAGTYEFTVHVSGVKGHAHTGTIEAK